MPVVIIKAANSIQPQHAHPCNECPFRRSSAPGWLGAYTLEEFVEATEAEVKMPCHMTVDYERDDWQTQVQLAPQCAGRAIYFANRCKIPRNGTLIRLPKDHDRVFSTMKAFIHHHKFGMKK